MSSIWKTLRHPITWQWMTGGLSFFFAYIILVLMNPEVLSGLAAHGALLYCLFMFVLIPGVNFFYITGRWTMERWRRVGYYVVILPSAIFLSYCAVNTSGYAFVAISILYGSQMVAMGFLLRHQYYTVAVVFLVCATAFIFLGFAARSIEPTLFMCVLSLIVVQITFAIAETSNIVRRQRSSIQSMLAAIRKDRRNVAAERQKSDKLLLNILPEKVAAELKETGRSQPEYFECASVLFTDFKGFTAIAEVMSPGELVSELDYCFSFFDSVTERYRLEKLKTIGDSYMAAGGLPIRNLTHAADCVLAALEVQRFMMQIQNIKKEAGLPYWELRLGIHSGPVVAGVIGEKKFAYDVWGDTVNMASRCESSGEPGKINISESTYNLVSEYFQCENRGKVSAKNKGEVSMYFVTGLHAEYSVDEDGVTPNDRFHECYASLARKP